MPARLLHLRHIICDEFSELKLKDEDACRVLPEHREERTKEIGHWHGAGQLRFRAVAGPFLVLVRSLEAGHQSLEGSAQAISRCAHAQSASGLTLIP
jgi:hypothetical protein